MACREIWQATKAKWQATFEGRLAMLTCYHLNSHRQAWKKTPPILQLSLSLQRMKSYVIRKSDYCEKKVPMIKLEYYQNTTVKIFVGEKLLYWLCGKISKVEWGFSTCFTENILNKTKPKIDTVMGRNSMPESTVWCIHTIHKHNFANN